MFFEIINGLENLNEEDLQQGNTWDSADFCIVLHPDVQWAHEQLQSRGGMTVFDMDNGCLTDPSDAMFQTTTDLDLATSAIENRGHPQSDQMYCVITDTESRRQRDQIKT